MLLPLSGLLLAMSMHALWNGSSSFGQYGFFAVYAAFMVPAFGLLTWLVIWTRQRELRTVRAELRRTRRPAGWPRPSRTPSARCAPAASPGSTPATIWPPAARAVAQYEAYATSLAFLRHRGRLGRARADFVVREQELLGALWERRAVARPALDHAARTIAPAPVLVPPPVSWPTYGQQPYAQQPYTHQPYGQQGYGPTTPYPATYNPYRS